MANVNQSSNQPIQNQASAPQSPTPTPAPPPVTGTAADDANVPKFDLQAAVVALITGLQANYQPTDVFQMSIGKLTRDDIITVAKAFLDDCEATKAKKQAWRAAVQTEKEALAELRPVRTAVHVFFQNLLGKGSAELRTYGFEPQKPRKSSVKAKAEGQQKAEQTRKEHKAPAAAPATPTKS